MAITRVRVLSLVVAAALCGVPALVSPDAVRQSAFAEDKPPTDGGKPGVKPDGGGKEGAGNKMDAAPMPRLERAKKLVQELETTITILKAAKTVDAETMKSLEKALEEAKKLAVPITVAELTDEEKKRIGAEFAKEAGGDPKDPPAAKDPPGGDWAKQALDNAFKDADLTEEEQVAASKIVGDWFPKSQKAWASRDSKAVSDLKNDRDEALTKALGKKKAMKVINNLNAMGPGRGR